MGFAVQRKDGHDLYLNGNRSISLRVMAKPGEGNHEFEVSVVYTMRPCLKGKKEKEKRSHS
jgi:hypothetical protein